MRGVFWTSAIFLFRSHHSDPWINFRGSTYRFEKGLKIFLATISPQISVSTVLPIMLLSWNRLVRNVVSEERSFPIFDLAFWLPNRLGFMFCKVVRWFLAGKRSIGRIGTLKTYLCCRSIPENRMIRTKKHSDLWFHVFAVQLSWIRVQWVCWLVLCWKTTDRANQFIENPAWFDSWR